ncbi:ribonuclease H-like domain-containing protein [Flammula alnicola]|nr:ribonuclease H-like domain-containing protein [Flammula alnicola]
MERYLPAEEARAFNEDLRHLDGRNNLTYLMDRWEDIQRRSVYGCMVAEVSQFPVVLGLEELSGVRAMADHLVQVSNRALTKKNIKPTSINAICTDNPMTMQAFRRKWTTEHSWIIPLFCFMHGINTIIGKVVAFPSAKEAVSKNSRIVTFFNGSHYWGGQLDEVAAGKGITRRLKTNTESRFYALILQALSVKDHKAALVELCSRDGAQRAVNGLSPVNKDVVSTVFDLSRWQLTDQLIRICKPLVDIIGDIESRDATLADCMLQLIWAHQAVLNTPLIDGDDPLFTDHAKRVLNAQFHAMNTDIHWLALFLHPLCRKLTVSTATHSRKLADAYRISLDIVQRWKWSREVAENLTRDLKAYHNGEAPFNGGKSDAKDWWKSLLVNVNSHPLKALAIKLFSIVPHAAEVERFFSNLGGVQSVKRSRLTIPHMQTFGTLRNHYIRQLHEIAIAAGKSTRCKHAHMHTSTEGGGLNVDRADDLFTDILWTPQLLTGYEGADVEGPESLSLDDIDAAFDQLEQQINSPRDGDGLSSMVPIEQVYDLSTLDDIRAGKVGPINVDDELEVINHNGATDTWDSASLLRSLGV